MKPAEQTLNLINFNLINFLRVFILLSPIAIFFYQSNGLTGEDFLFFQGIFYFISLIFELPIGYLADYIDRQKLLALSMIIFGGVSILWYFKCGFWIVLVGEIGLAISKIILDTSSSGYLFDYLKSYKQEKFMAKQLGICNTSRSFGTAIASILGTIFYVKMGLKNTLLAQVIFCTIGIILALFLTKIPPQKIKKYSLKNNLLDFKNTLFHIMKNNYLKIFMFYSGMLVALSVLFSTSFQPIMEMKHFPVYLFGVVTFFNHFSRGATTLFTGRILSFLGLQKTSQYVYLSFLIVFIFFITILTTNSTKFNFAIIILICLFICLQLTYTIGHISYFHKIIKPKLRSAVTSFNFFIARFLTALILLSSKIILPNFGYLKYFMFYGIIFAIVGFALLFNGRNAYNE